MAEITHNAKQGSAFSTSFEIIKEGYLQVKSSGRLRSTWRKVWCQMRRHSSASLGAVQLSQYKSQMDAEQDLGCLARIDLGNATAIRTTPEQKKKHSFLVECTSAARIGTRHMSLQSSTFHFCASSEDETEVWVQVLRRNAPSLLLAASSTLRKNLTGSLPNLSEKGGVKQRDSLSSLKFNDMYQPSASTYLVDFQGALSVPFKGKSTINISASSITLSDPHNIRQVLWPVSSIRKYGIRDHLFYFESGRACSTGPGTFSFNTDSDTAEDIVKKLRFVSKMLAERAKESRVAGDGSGYLCTPVTDQPTSSYGSTEATATGMLVRSASDNCLLSESNILQRLQIESDSAGPYSVTRIRDSWIALSKALNRSPAGAGGDDENSADDEDDVGDMTCFPAAEVCTTAVKLRSHSAPMKPMINIAAHADTPLDRRYERVPGRALPGGEAGSRQQAAAATEQTYARVLPKVLPQGTSPQSGSPPVRCNPKDLSPLLLTSDLNSLAIEHGLEATAQAALRRRYSPIFVASREQSPRMSHSSHENSSRNSPSIPGTPYSQTPLRSPAQWQGPSSPFRSPPRTCSPIASPVLPSSASSSHTSSCSPLSACSPMSPSDPVSAAAASPALSGYDHIDRNGRLGLACDPYDYVDSPMSRTRSASEPARISGELSSGYDCLDHESQRVNDGYARLAHPPPALPPKPVGNEDGDGYSKLCRASPVIPNGKGLVRRVAKRISDQENTRVRAQSDSVRRTSKHVNTRSAIRRIELAS